MDKPKLTPAIRNNKGKYCSGVIKCFRCGHKPCICNNPMKALNKSKEADAKAEKVDNKLTSNKDVLELRLKARALGVENFNAMDKVQLEEAINGFTQNNDTANTEHVTQADKKADVPQDKPAKVDKKALRLMLANKGVKVHHATGKEKLLKLCEENGIDV